MGCKPTSLGWTTMIFVVMLFLSACVCWQYMYSHSHPPKSTQDLRPSLPRCDHSCIAYHHRLDKYCHRSLLQDQDEMDHHFPVAEGIVSVEGLELEHVHIVARHGDRSPITSYVLGSPIFYDCGLVEDAHNSTWSRLRDFPPLQALRGAEEASSINLALYPGCNSRQCGVGKLTAVGFYQHRALGQQMHRKYATVLGNFTGQWIADRIFIQSTDTSRTIQSAAAFMLGFLPDERRLRRKVTIHVSPGTSLKAPPPGIEPVFKPCKHFLSFLQSEQTKSGYLKIEKTQYHPLLEKFSRMFRLHDVQNKPIITQLFDSVATRGCHTRDSPLPCYNTQCLDYDFANKLFEFSDWTFSNFCANDGSMVSMLPFLRHSLLGLMEAVVRGEKESKKFVLSLSHDTFMTCLLFALGVKVDGWIPYASRITFELWRVKSSSPPDTFQVRILFNGVPVTPKLAAITGDNQDSELLPYTSWKSFIENGRYRDPVSYDEACGNT